VYEAASRLRRAFYVRTLTQHEVDVLLSELKVREQHRGHHDE
jgi:hypothetical protein